MADIDDDDDYGSDTFDDLPPNTLFELERQAFLSTQQHQRGNSGPGGQLQNRWQRQVKQQDSYQDSYQSEKTLQADSHGADDYEFNNEDIIDLDQNPYANVDSLRQSYHNASNAFVGEVARELRAGVDNGPSGIAYRATTNDAAADQINVAELQARILELENDRLNLQKQVEEARSTAQSKAGEAAILRQKAEKTAKDYEQKVSTLRQIHAEEFAKQKLELERVKNEREKVVTDNRFLEHDLALEAGRNRQNQRTTKSGNIESRSKSGQFGSPAVTPKKAKSLPYRDGFDDEDLVMVSPSRARDRSKPTTPSKLGAKRKRTGNELASPIPPPQLPLSEPKPSSMPPPSLAEVKFASELLLQVAKGQKKLRFIQNLLRHQVSEDPGENILEALTKFAFPSNPEMKLSARIFEQLCSRPIASSDNKVADVCCNILLSLWEQCLAESYYPPLHSIIASLQNILQTERFTFARQYISRIVPLAVATSDLVAIPVARASLKKNLSPSSSVSSRSLGVTVQSTSTQSNINQSGIAERLNLDKVDDVAASCIDVLACLMLLRTLAEAATSSPDAIKVFWQNMKFDFVLLILMRAQPVAQIGLMLELLHLASLKESFGAIVEDAERQARREADTVDRLTLLLGEKFGDANIASTEVFELREKVVKILLTLVLEEHGLLLLATHRYAIGRLFKFLHDSIRALYTYTQPFDQESLARVINDTVKILYLLCSSTGSSQSCVNVDVRQKLSIIPGGLHLHLLALTRLAFAERIWFERGIEEGTVERAHEMLDEWLSPEEGEGLMMLFGSEGSGDAPDTQ